MRKISLETLKELNSGGFMLRCCLCGVSPVHWHHNLIFAHAQSDEWWTILPVCPSCHANEKKPVVKERLDWIMLCRAPKERLILYSKVENLVEKRDRLIIKFGKYEE